MPEKLSPEEKLAGINLRFDVLMSEYKIVRDEAAKSRQMQGQLDSLALAGLGLSIPLILAILDRSSDEIGAILLIPILFFAIAFTQLRHERTLILRAMYADLNLRSRISELLSQISTSQTPILEYERFLAQGSWVPRMFLEWIATTSRAGISLAIGAGLLVIFFYLRLGSSNWNTYEALLLIVNFAMLVGDVVVGFFVGRIRHNYLLQQDYFKKPQ